MIKQFDVTRRSERECSVFLTVQGGEDYSVVVRIIDQVGQVSPSNCTCLFGSMYAQTKTNREKKKVCRHLTESIELLKYLKYLTEWEYIE